MLNFHLFSPWSAKERKREAKEGTGDAQKKRDTFCVPYASKEQTQEVDSTKEGKELRQILLWSIAFDRVCLSQKRMKMSIVSLGGMKEGGGGMRKNKHVDYTDST